MKKHFPYDTFPVGLTIYGSDLYWYRRSPAHLHKLIQVLGFVTHLFCECERDAKIALELGFEGNFAPRAPAFGAIELMPLRKNPRKRRIMVKAYQNKWGQGKLIIRALESIASKLDGFEIVVFSAENSAYRLAKKLKTNNPHLKVRIHKKNELPHDDLLEMMSDALVYVAASKSDGISASMIEAMACGAFPIQTDTSCASEWLVNGETGILIASETLSSDKISEAILNAIGDEARLESARLKNHALITEKISNQRLSDTVLDYYQDFTRSRP